jgi:hypothetical protein
MKLRYAEPGEKFFTVDYQNAFYDNLEHIGPWVFIVWIRDIQGHE